jgi:hypothetical protein
MDWLLAIGRQCAALRMVVAVFVAMVGASHGRAADVAELAADRPTLARHRHRALLRLVRPAEAAARRLVIALALAVPAADEAFPVAPDTVDAAAPDAGAAPGPRAAAAPPPAARPVPPTARTPPEAEPAARPAGTSPDTPDAARQPEATEAEAPAAVAPEPAVRRPRRLVPPRRPRAKPAVLRGGAGIVLPYAPLLPLIDPVRRVRIRRVAMRDLPRIAVAGYPLPVRPPRRPLPKPDDRLDATRLILRIRALAEALEDLPGEARRFRRWHARHAAHFARACAAEAARIEQHAALETRYAQAGARFVCLPGGFGLAGVRPLPPAKPIRIPRRSPLRAGRPPGGRRKPLHEVHSILAEANHLAHWALSAHDTS